MEDQATMKLLQDSGLRLIWEIFSIPLVLLLYEYLHFVCCVFEYRVDVWDEFRLKFSFRLKRPEACDFVDLLVKFNQAIFRD